MKISLYTISLNGGYYDGPAVGLLEIFSKAKAWGYDGIEIEAKRPHGSPLDLDDAARKDIRQAAEDTGLEISCIASYNDFSSPVEEHRENELLMVREQIRLAADLGSPLVRVFSFWSGVTRRDGRITYDIARHNVTSRFPGTTPLEQWRFVRECLAEAAKMAEDAGVVLALQNHKPIIDSYRHTLDFIAEVDSPALKACLDSPLLNEHTQAYYRQALEATGDLMVYTHFGGRFAQGDDGGIVRAPTSGHHYRADDATFFRLAKEIAGFDGHIGYELCSPVLTDHRHEGLDYALKQAEWACKFMRGIIDSL